MPYNTCWDNQIKLNVYKLNYSGGNEIFTEDVSDSDISSLIFFRAATDESIMCLICKF